MTLYNSFNQKSYTMADVWRANNLIEDGCKILSGCVEHFSHLTPYQKYKVEEGIRRMVQAKECFDESQLFMSGTGYGDYTHLDLGKDQEVIDAMVEAMVSVPVEEEVGV